MTPNYSSLTTDIGTNSKFYNLDENLDPVQYFKGVDMWKENFDMGMRLYDKRYNTNISSLPFLQTYPERNTLSGEFVNVGPIASNDFLHR